MKRSHWGESEDGFEKRSETKPHEIILPEVKAEKLKILKNAVKTVEKRVHNIELKNPLVTQTIEVMNQTEMLQTLIDTYANKSGFNNYLLNPCQMIPKVDFPPENSADLVNDDKFAKPLWFIPPLDTAFSRGVPRNFVEINQEVARRALRKSIAGLSRIVGFDDASDNCLVLFTDVVEEHIRTLLKHIRDVQINESKDKSNILNILLIEKGYYSLTHNSLTTIHNYFKNDIIKRNRNEIAEFKDVYQEYDKLMEESQKMQKVQFKDDDYMNFLDFTGTNTQESDVGNVNIMNLLETDNTNSTEQYEFVEKT